MEAEFLLAEDSLSELLIEHGLRFSFAKLEFYALHK